MAENLVVTKDGRKYKTRVTDVGNEKIARAALEGKKVDVVTAVVTDGGGGYFLPTQDMTELPNEVWRGEIASKKINPLSKNMIDVRIFLDGSVGGFTVRGIGLLDAEGDLIAVCNMPDTEKVMIVDGIAATLTLIMHIVVTHVDVLEFKVDPSVDTVSSAELEAALKENTGKIMERVEELVAGSGCVLTLDITISAQGWESGEGDAGEPSGPRLDIPNEAIREDMVPTLTILPAWEETAQKCGLRSAARTLDGALRVYAQAAPDAEMRASLMLASQSGSVNAGGGSGYVLPAATKTRLGGVKIGPGVGVEQDGTIRVDVAEVAASDESTREVLDGVFGSEQDGH